MDSKDKMDTIGKNLIKTILSSNTFGDEVFDQLSVAYNSPERLFILFSMLIQDLLSSDIDKKVFFEKLYNDTLVSKSPLLLDAFLTAMSFYNAKQTSLTTPFHMWINDELTKKDWGKLNNPRILNWKELPDRGVISQFIYEITFSHSEPSDLAQSQFIDVNVDETYSLLSEKAKNIFADALLLKYTGDPFKLFERLNTSEQELTYAIFRKRDDYSILQNALKIDDKSQMENFITNIQALYQKLYHKKDLLPLFTTAILPYASDMPEDFLRNVIQDPKFPSNDPTFPVDAFISSNNCVQFINVKVLFDLCNKNIDLDFVIKVFNDIIVNLQVDDVMIAIINSPISVITYMRSLFLLYIKSIVITSDELYDIISIFCLKNPETICDLLQSAIDEGIKLEVLLTEDILRTLLDAAFYNPEPFFSLLIKMSSNDPPFDSVLQFWKLPEPLPSIVDSINGFHKYSNELNKFLLDLASQASEQIVKTMVRHMVHLPSFGDFLRICQSRFDSDSIVAHKVTKYSS